VEENVLDIEGLYAQLEQWYGRNINIEQRELRDKEYIQMVLESITYGENTRTIDDYAATYTLHLNGSGNIMTDGTKQELPNAVYDIPLEDHATFKMQGNDLLLHTDRGTYKITAGP